MMGDFSHYPMSTQTKIWKENLKKINNLATLAAQNAENANFFKKITKNENFFCNFLEINLHWKKMGDCSQHAMSSQTKIWKENLKKNQ